MSQPQISGQKISPVPFRGWLSPTVIMELLTSFHELGFNLSTHPPHNIEDGSIYIYDVISTPKYRDDGVNWVRKKSGNRIREDFHRIKVDDDNYLTGLYTYQANNKLNRRRIYHNNSETRLKLVHYRFERPHNLSRIPRTVSYGDSNDFTDEESNNHKMQSFQDVCDVLDDQAEKVECSLNKPAIYDNSLEISESTSNVNKHLYAEEDLSECTIQHEVNIHKAGCNSSEVPTSDMPITIGKDNSGLSVAASTASFIRSICTLYPTVLHGPNPIATMPLAAIQSAMKTKYRSSAATPSYPSLMNSRVPITNFFDASSRSTFSSHNQPITQSLISDIYQLGDNQKVPESNVSSASRVTIPPIKSPFQQETMDYARLLLRPNSTTPDGSLLPACVYPGGSAVTLQPFCRLPSGLYILPRDQLTKEKEESDNAMIVDFSPFCCHTTGGEVISIAVYPPLKIDVYASGLWLKVFFERTGTTNSRPWGSVSDALVISPTCIRCTTPAAPAGSYSLRITTFEGKDLARPSNIMFHYIEDRVCCYYAL